MAVLLTPFLRLIVLAVSARALRVPLPSLPLHGRAASACTLQASGGDDAPAFLDAVADASCPTVTIPAGTTLSIRSNMNMTGTTNKHIVGIFLCLPSLYWLNARRPCCLQSLEGTIQFNPDLDYWSDNAFTFSFQDQAAFWLLGGTSIALDGGGTLDGSGQAWYDEL